MPDSDASTAPSRAPPFVPRPPDIALVGSASNFSDNLVQATRRHLHDHELIHLPSLEALATLPMTETQWLRLVLIDDVTAADMPAAVADRLRLPPPTRFALAFHAQDLAAGIYDDNDRTLPIDSYVPLNVRLDIWLSILRLLLHGGRYVPEELLAPHRQPRAEQPSPPAKAALGLTQRQYGVLALVAAGHPNKVIAARLGVSDHTVKLHIHNIISRLGVENRTQAAALFHEGPR